MKHSFYSTSAFFNKAILIFSLMLLFQTNSFAQGPKWATLGNATSTGDFIGSTNSQPFVIKTNNITRGTFTTSGSFQLNNLIGTGSRLLQTDATGNIIPFTMGTSTQVLYGNGIWGSLPTPPVALWNSSGSNIYYNTGNVGIGTTSPLFPLDVIGDVRISNNLYVGGGIVISDKVNANAEVVTGKMRADSIVTDSTKGFYGTSKFNGDVKLSSKLNVNGTATIGGPLKLLGGLILTPVGPISVDPCISLMSIDPLTGFVTPVSATAIEAVFDATATGTEPCPTTTIPFVWGTYGNHVNNNFRWIGTIENFDFRIKTFSTLRMIVKNDGKVGIGTATPTEKLQLDNGNMLIRGANNFGVSGNEAILILGDENHFIKSISGTGLKIGTFGVAEGIFLQQSSGNVGIGTDLASNVANYKLSVNGNIRAKRVVVETLWSDFVFANTYKLNSLEYVEEYIKLNGHLPEIPNAFEIEKNGADLGGLVKLQMQKIEELTLYIIQQNKRIELLESKVK